MIIQKFTYTELDLDTCPTIRDIELKLKVLGVLNSGECPNWRELQNGKLIFSDSSNIITIEDIEVV